jgi:hypothetical protein
MPSPGLHRVTIAKVSSFPGLQLKPYLSYMMMIIITTVQTNMKDFVIFEVLKAVKM